MTTAQNVKKLQYRASLTGKRVTSLKSKPAQNHSYTAQMQDADKYDPISGYGREPVMLFILDH